MPDTSPGPAAGSSPHFPPSARPDPAPSGETRRSPSRASSSSPQAPDPGAHLVIEVQGPGLGHGWSRKRIRRGTWTQHASTRLWRRRRRRHAPQRWPLRPKTPPVTCANERLNKRDAESKAAQLPGQRATRRNCAFLWKPGAGFSPRELCDLFVQEFFKMLVLFYSLVETGPAL